MAPSVSTDAAAAASTCGCPNQCKKIEHLPIDQGIMIMLHVPPSDDDGSRHAADTKSDDPNSSSVDSSAESAPNRPSLGASWNNGNSLKLHPQSDANLPQFHPNIYIPSPLLEYPDHLVKYGGGGSGVTVFGGYHPLLGNLVMKHGGHKDLIELVSLAKIEREMGVRGKWKIDCLLNEDSDKQKMNQTDHVVGSKGESNVPNDYDESTNQNQNGGEQMKGRPNRFTLASNPATAMINTLVHPLDAMKKLKSQPALTSMVDIISIPVVHSADNLSPADNLSASYRNYLRKKQGSNSCPASAAANESIKREIQIQEIQSAMSDMKRRIPAFRMIYISPMHLRERKEELEHRTYRPSRSYNVGGVGDFSKGERNPEIPMARNTRCSSEGQVATPMPSFNEDNNGTPPGGKRIRRLSSVMRKGRQLHLFGSKNAKASLIQVQEDHVDLCFGGNYHRWKGFDEMYENLSSDGSDGYASLVAFVEHLRHEQEKNEWKITLAQQKIGQINENGQTATTASSLLAQGKLHGPLLHHLIDNQIQVIRNLQLMTMPEELDVVEQVRTEYENILSYEKETNQRVSAAEVSPMANSFVGKAIHKNFDPISGRFVMLRRFGVDLRRGGIHLKPKEVIPAKHLENLFFRAWEMAGEDVDGCSDGAMDGEFRNRPMEETFNMLYSDHPTGNNSDQNHHHPMFVLGLDQWKSLLELSLSIQHPAATNRIWTCGLTDGGLHNMFLSEDDLWLFDLGEPNLEPIPAFLTKFLMSFFHTLGMEEDDNGDWVVRFEQDDSGKLRLTQRTMDILPKVMEAFNITMDRLIQELFGGEEKIRVLLLRYVITQLISDAAFCIEKWRIKGGGDEERSEHQYFLEKWLWRALWDVYASEEIRRRYLTRMIFRKQFECRDLSSTILGTET